MYCSVVSKNDIIKVFKILYIFWLASPFSRLQIIIVAWIFNWTPILSCSENVNNNKTLLVQPVVASSYIYYIIYIQSICKSKKGMLIRNTGGHEDLLELKGIWICGLIKFSTGKELGLEVVEVLVEVEGLPLEWRTAF